MRKKNSITKNIGGFAPELHWDIILLCMCVLAVSLSGYVGFLYVSFDGNVEHMETTTAANDATTYKDEESLKKIINMESVIVGYREKERAYKDLIKALVVRATVPAVVATTTSTTTTATTSSVASSSLR